MITQELVQFIKQQLSIGKSREQISQMLQSNGWLAADVNEGFAHVVPPQPAPQAPAVAPVISPAPIIQQAQPIQQPIQPQVQPQMNPVTQQPQPQQPPIQYTTQPIQPMQNLMQSGHSFKNPSFIMGALLVLVASAIFTGAVFVLKSKAVGSLGSSAILIEFVVMVIALFIGSAIFLLVTKICAVRPRSYAKSLVFVSIEAILGAILYLVSVSVQGIPALVIGIVGFVLGIVIFKFYYETTILKTILVWVVNIILSGIFAVVCFLVVSALEVGIISFLVHSSGVANLTPLAPNNSFESNTTVNQPSSQGSQGSPQGL